MAETKGKKSGNGEGGVDTAASVGGAPQAISARLAIRLTPVGNSDQPVVANYSVLNVAPGMAFIDFGFLEPGVLAALPRVARQGGKLPETINGRLAVRVALGYDTLAGLHQQIGGRVLTGRRQQQGAGEREGG